MTHSFTSVINGFVNSPLLTCCRNCSCHMSLVCSLSWLFCTYCLLLNVACTFPLRGEIPAITCVATAEIVQYTLITLTSALLCTAISLFLYRFFFFLCLSIMGPQIVPPHRTMLVIFYFLIITSVVCEANCNLFAFIHLYPIPIVIR